MISKSLFATTAYYIIPYLIFDKAVCLKGLHGSKHLPPHLEHLCCPTKVSHLHRSHVHCSVHHQSITLIGSIVTYVNKCCKNVPKSSLLHCIATIVINILFSGAIILQNQFNADYGSKIPI